MAHELAIRATVLVAGRFETRTMGIDRGRISAVEHGLRGEREYDFSGYLALPGGVDVHTHMREPGHEHKENFFTGTKAAALGGTTTVMDMPNNIPPSDTAEALERKLALVSENANVDFGLFGMLSDPAEIGKMADTAIGFKLFMSETTSAAPADPEALLRSPLLAGKVVTVHAEDPALFEHAECTDLHAHGQIRGLKAEAEAVRRVLAVQTQARVNLAHLTSRESADMAQRAKVSFEMTPHHMLLDDSMPLGAKGKVNPPLRKRQVAERLFEVAKTGRAIIASDHAPHTEAEKGADFPIAPSGVPGVETRIPLMLAMAQKGVLKHQAVQDMCCTLPADLFGLRKGHIAPGYDADLAFYDLANVVRIEGRELHSKCGWTPFEGFEAIFPSGVMLRGRMIVRGGELVLEKTGNGLAL